MLLSGVLPRVLFLLTPHIEHSQEHSLELGTPWPGTEVSRALRARNPKRVRKESDRVSRPGEPQSPQRVRYGVRKESKNAASDSFWSLFGLRGALFGDSGAPRAGARFRTLFGDFFGVPGPKGPGHLCAWPGRSQPWSTPNLPAHSRGSTSRSTPISGSTLGSTSQSTFRDFPL